MEKKKRIELRKLLISAIFIFSLAGLGVSQVYSQTNPITGVMDNSQLTVDTPLATAGDQATPTPTKDAYAIIDAYAKIGRPDLAYNQLQTAIIENPKQIIEQKEKLNKLNWFIFWEEVRKVYLYFIIIIIILLVMLLKSIMCKLDISEFEPGVEITCKPCKAFQSLVEEKIWDLSNRNGLREKYFINQPLEDVSFENTTTSKLDDVVGLIKFINKIIPPNVITMSGTLHYSYQRGAGVTMRLVKGKKEILTERTFWQNDYDLGFISSDKTNNTDCFYSLAEPVALWIAWYTTDSFNGKRYGLLIRLARKIKLIIRAYLGVPNKLRKIYGTENLDSYLNNYIGTNYYKNGKIDIYKKYLLQSRSLDSYNRPTLYNLAILKIFEANIECIRDGEIDLSKVNFVEPIRLLNEIILLSGKDDIFPLDDLDFHNKDTVIDQEKEQKSKIKKECNYEFNDQILILTYYFLGVICKYYYVLNNYDESYKKILNYGIEMLKKSESLIQKITNYEISHKRKLLSESNKEMIRVAKVGFINLYNFNPVDDPEILEIKNVPLEKSFDVNYNLACYYSSMASLLKKNRPDLIIERKKYAKNRENYKVTVNAYMEKVKECLYYKDLPISEVTREDMINLSKIDPSLLAFWKWQDGK